MSDLPISFGEDGQALVPVVTQEASSGQVLMVGFMNRLAFDRTRETGLVHYWSRSRAKLWQKGETSGHVQRVQAIYVNCEQNTLLMEVEQVGAVCHDGYPTCYYRRLEPDNSLTVVRDRWFDPADVYGDASTSAPDTSGTPNAPGAPNGLETVTRAWWAAFETLRDTDLTAESGTSRMLRTQEDTITPRIVDELGELAGVLDGTHVHRTQAEDAALEGGQVCYWLALRGVHAGLLWGQVRPDRALDAPDDGDIPSPGALSTILRAQAAQWQSETPQDLAARLHETFALAAAAMASLGVAPLEVIRADLDSLRRRPYLASLIASTTGTMA
ncbi:MAG: phosphoribosyl-AMP cyclohydrolase [Thermomicrobiales bacterium]